jgi:hypothetical protein
MLPAASSKEQQVPCHWHVTGMHAVQGDESLEALWAKAAASGPLSEMEKDELQMQQQRLQHERRKLKGRVSSVCVPESEAASSRYCLEARVLAAEIT